MSKIYYFDNAATSFPKPEEVAHSVFKCLKNYCANPGRSSHNLSIKSAKIVFDTRENIAEFFNFPYSEHFIFTLNATESINIALNGFLKEGDYVLITYLEHNSVLRPLNFLKKVKKINYEFVEFSKKHGIDFDNFKKKLSEKTPNLVIINHASNVTGQIIDLNNVLELKEKYNFKLLIDAAQSGGIIEFDLKEQDIDFLALTGHKGLYGPQGTGILFIREPDLIKPLKFGGTGSFSENDYQPNFLPDKFESGTLNVPGIAGLNEGIKFIRNIGIDKIYEKKKKLVNYFIEQLKLIEKIKIFSQYDNNIGVVSLNIESLSPSNVAKILDKRYNIATRPGLHCAPLIHKKIDTFPQGTVRFSFSFFNELNEIEYCLNALKEIVACP